MPRRSSNKVSMKVLEVETTETTVSPTKGRKAVKVDTTEVVAKIEQISPAKSMKAKVGVDSDDEPLTTPKKSSAKPKISSVKSKTVLEEAQNPKQKASGKRKAKTEDDDNEDAEEKKVPKKRKTKEEKEAEAMPLVARTLIGSLKKAMHIGAHVSGAGGESSSTFSKKSWNIAVVSNH